MTDEQEGRGPKARGIVVALTGGIAAGKTTALRMFAEIGADTFSADEYVHELYRRPEIKDILSYLRVVVDPGDNIALARILISRRFQVSDRDLYFLGQWKKKAAKEAEEAEDLEMPVALIDAIAHAAEVPQFSAAAVGRLESLKADIEDFIQQAVKLSVPGLVMHILNRTGYLAELQSDPRPEARIAELNMQKLVDMASEFQLANAQASLPSFVMYVQQAIESSDQEGEVRPIDEGSDMVKVMTVHQSKGLEFP